MMTQQAAGAYCSARLRVMMQYIQRPAAAASVNGRNTILYITKAVYIERSAVVAELLALGRGEVSH
jgi:hypothetical protein